MTDTQAPNLPERIWQLRLKEFEMGQRLYERYYATLERLSLLTATANAIGILALLNAVISGDIQIFGEGTEGELLNASFQVCVWQLSVGMISAIIGWTTIGEIAREGGIGICNTIYQEAGSSVPVPPKRKWKEWLCYVAIVIAGLMPQFVLWQVMNGDLPLFASALPQ